MAYIADASTESVRMSAKSSALANSAKRALWLKTWQGDSAFKVKSCGIPVTGDLLFGPGLDLTADNNSFPVKHKLPVQAKKGFVLKSAVESLTVRVRKKPWGQRGKGREGRNISPS